MMGGGYQAGDYHMADYSEADDGYGDGWSSGYGYGKGALPQRHYNGAGRYAGQAGYDYLPTNASNRNQFYPPSTMAHKGGAGYGMAGKGVYPPAPPGSKLSKFYQQQQINPADHMAAYGDDYNNGGYYGGGGSMHHGMHNQSRFNTNYRYNTGGYNQQAAGYQAQSRYMNASGRFRPGMYANGDDNGLDKSDDQLKVPEEDNTAATEEDNAEMTRLTDLVTEITASIAAASTSGKEISLTPEQQDILQKHQQMQMKLQQKKNGPGAAPGTQAALAAAAAAAAAAKKLPNYRLLGRNIFDAGVKQKFFGGARKKTTNTYYSRFIKQHPTNNLPLAFQKTLGLGEEKSQEEKVQSVIELDAAIIKKQSKKIKKQLKLKASGGVAGGSSSSSSSSSSNSDSESPSADLEEGETLGPDVSKKSKKKKNKKRNSSSSSSSSSSNSSDDEANKSTKQAATGQAKSTKRAGGASSKHSSGRRNEDPRASDDNDSDSSMLDLREDLRPISAYVRDRERLLEEMFRCVKGQKLRAMLPDILKNLPFEKLRSKCIEVLDIMSKKRIRCLLEDKQMTSSSGTDETSTDSEHDEERYYNSSIRQLTEKTNIKSEPGSALNKTSKNKFKPFGSEVSPTITPTQSTTSLTGANKPHGAQVKTEPKLRGEEAEYGEDGENGENMRADSKERETDENSQLEASGGTGGQSGQSGMNAAGFAKKFIKKSISIRIKTGDQGGDGEMDEEEQQQRTAREEMIRKQNMLLQKQRKQQKQLDTVSAANSKKSSQEQAGEEGMDAKPQPITLQQQLASQGVRNPSLLVPSQHQSGQAGHSNMPPGGQYQQYSQQHHHQHHQHHQQQLGSGGYMAVQQPPPGSFAYPPPMNIPPPNVRMPGTGAPQGMLPPGAMFNQLPPPTHLHHQNAGAQAPPAYLMQQGPPMYGQPPGYQHAPGNLLPPGYPQHQMMPPGFYNNMAGQGSAAVLAPHHLAGHGHANHHEMADDYVNVNINDDAAYDFDEDDNDEEDAHSDSDSDAGVRHAKRRHGNKSGQDKRRRNKQRKDVINYDYDYDDLGLDLEDIIVKPEKSSSSRRDRKQNDSKRRRRNREQEEEDDEEQEVNSDDDDENDSDASDSDAEQSSRKRSKQSSKRSKQSSSKRRQGSSKKSSSSKKKPKNEEEESEDGADDDLSAIKNMLKNLLEMHMSKVENDDQFDEELKATLHNLLDQVTSDDGSLTFEECTQIHSTITTLFSEEAEEEEEAEQEEEERASSESESENHGKSGGKRKRNKTRKSDQEENDDEQAEDSPDVDKRNGVNDGSDYLKPAKKQRNSESGEVEAGEIDEM